MTNIPPSYSLLRTEDNSWDYRGEFTKRLTHGFHSYPAMMIPQVARRLIESYSKSGDTILDPFSGSGSVLVEARAMGRKSWGIDLNPVALLIARAKTTPIEPRLLRKAYCQVLDRLDLLCSEEIATPDFFNVEFWFKLPVVQQLSRLKRAIEDGVAAFDLAVREFFLVAFSEAVRLSSNSRSHEFKLYRYSTEKLAHHNPDAIMIFRDKVEKNIDRMAELCRVCREVGVDCWCRPLHADSTAPVREIADGTVDLVVTSPPYGDSRTTVAYGQFSRLSAQWLGFDDQRARHLDAHLMGGRVAATLQHKLNCVTLDEVLAAISQSDPVRARQVLSFYVDLEKALRNVARTVRKGGRLCIVIGNRRVKKVQLPTDVIIAEMAVGIGLTPDRIIVRNIPNKTMPLKNSPTNVTGELELTMHKEYIVILEKQDDHHRVGLDGDHNINRTVERQLDAGAMADLQHATLVGGKDEIVQA